MIWLQIRVMLHQIRIEDVLGFEFLDLVTYFAVYFMKKSGVIACIGCQCLDAASSHVLNL
jgi:hypothetical protein